MSPSNGNLARTAIRHGTLRHHRAVYGMCRLGALMFTCVAVVVGPLANADEWWPPQAFETESKNHRFVARVIPSDEVTGPSLNVFEMQAEQRVSRWAVELARNSPIPMAMHLTNDGSHVVTLDNHGRAGYGDDVLAFYNRLGLLKKYSLAQILDVDDEDLTDLPIPSSVSSRWWRAHAVDLFHGHGGRDYFCIWLGWQNRWHAWNIQTGEKEELDDHWIKQLDQIGHERALKSLKKDPSDISACKFLARVRRPEDRRLIEAALTDTTFSTGYCRVEISGHWLFGDLRKLWFEADSHVRREADRMLAHWDGKRRTEAHEDGDRYSYLGVVHGQVVLPIQPGAQDGFLWIVLIPMKEDQDRWIKKWPVHRLQVDFGDFFSWSDAEERRYITKTIEFRIAGVTPGSYRVQAFWDRAAPFDQESDDNRFPPGQGDYLGTTTSTIDVKANDIILNVNVNCTQRVKDRK